MDKKKVKKIIQISFGLVAILLIIYSIFLLIEINIEKNTIPKLENKLVGMWQNLEKNVTISFFMNKTYFTDSNNISYTGNWQVEQAPWNLVYLNWEGFEARYIFIFSEQNTKLMLSGYSEGTQNIELIKVDE